MPRYDLKDISVRLSHSPNISTAIFEVLRAVEDANRGVRAALAFYEASEDSLVDVYERGDSKLLRRRLKAARRQLPPNLAEVVFPTHGRSAAGDSGDASTPFYRAETADGTALLPLTPLTDWNTLVAVPLRDHEECLGILIVATSRKNALPDKDVAEMFPMLRVATMAVAHFIYRQSSDQAAQQKFRLEREVMGTYEEQMAQLAKEQERLREESQSRAGDLLQLADKAEEADQSTLRYRQELQRVKMAIYALEEQTSMATEFLTTAQHDASATQNELSEVELTVSFLKDLFQMLGQEHDPAALPQMMLAWFCKQFAFERCSMMTIQEGGETLRVAADYGLDPEVARNVEVKIGEGVAGWVAYHGKPLFVRVRDEAGALALLRQGYNSDSFIAAPLVHNRKLFGVLNVSNKRDGQAFTESDLDRVMMAAGVLAQLLVRGGITLRAAA